MGWRAASAAFSAGTYTGGLNKGTGGGFAEGFASTFSPAVSEAADIFVGTVNARRAEEAEIRREDRQFQRQVDLLNLRQSMSRSSGAAGRSRAANEEDEEFSEGVLQLARAFGAEGDPAAMAYIASTVAANDGDFSQAMNAIEDAVQNRVVTFGTGAPAASTAVGSVTNPAAPSVPGVGGVPNARPVDQIPQAPLADPSIFPNFTPASANMDDLEATEEGLTTTASTQGFDMPDPASNNAVEVQPAVFRPEEDGGEETQAQFALGTGMGGSEPELSFGSRTEPALMEQRLPGTTPAPAPAQQQGFVYDGEAAFRAEVASQSLNEISARLEMERNAPNPNPRTIELLQQAETAKLEEFVMRASDDELAGMQASNNQALAEAARRVSQARFSYRDRMEERPEAILADITTPEEALAASLLVNSDPTMTQAMKDAYNDALTEHMEGLFQIQERQNQSRASAEREFNLYAALDQNGMVTGGGAGMLRLRMNQDGQYENEAGQVVEGNFIPIVQDDVENTIRYNNTRIQEITDPMATAANTVRDLLDIREIVAGNPAVVNRFSAPLQSINSFLSDARAMTTNLVRNGLMEEGREYTREEMFQIVQGQDMGSDQKEINLLVLRAAYGLASMEGSSGQALSNQELDMNINSVIGTGSPESIIRLLNRNVQRVVERSETDRSTRADGMVIFGQGGEAMFSDAIWRTPMSDFIPQKIGEDRQEAFQSAMRGEIPQMSYTPPPAETSPAPAEEPAPAASWEVVPDGSGFVARQGNTVMRLNDTLRQQVTSMLQDGSLTPDGALESLRSRGFTEEQIRQVIPELFEGDQ